MRPNFRGGRGVKEVGTKTQVFAKILVEGSPKEIWQNIDIDKKLYQLYQSYLIELGILNTPTHLCHGHVEETGPFLMQRFKI